MSSSYFYALINVNTNESAQNIKADIEQYEQLDDLPMFLSMCVDNHIWLSLHGIDNTTIEIELDGKYLHEEVALEAFSRYLESNGALSCDMICFDSGSNYYAIYKMKEFGISKVYESGWDKGFDQQYLFVDKDKKDILATILRDRVIFKDDYRSEAEKNKELIEGAKKSVESQIGSLSIPQVFDENNNKLDPGSLGLMLAANTIREKYEFDEAQQVAIDKLVQEAYKAGVATALKAVQDAGCDIVDSDNNNITDGARLVPRWPSAF